MTGLLYGLWFVVGLYWGLTIASAIYQKMLRKSRALTDEAVALANTMLEGIKELKESIESEIEKHKVSASETTTNNTK